jgi:toxin CcdB
LQFEGEAYVLMIPQLAGIARKELGPAIESVVEQRGTVLATVDFLFTGF